MPGTATRRDPPRPQCQPHPSSQPVEGRPRIATAATRSEPHTPASPKPRTRRDSGRSRRRGPHERATASLDLRLEHEPSGRLDHNPTQRTIGSRSRLRSRGNQCSRGHRARSMAVPDEDEARDKSRIRWDGSVRRGSPGPAAMMRFGLRPGWNRPGPVFRQAS